MESQIAENNFYFWRRNSLNMCVQTNTSAEEMNRGTNTAENRARSTSENFILVIDVTQSAPLQQLFARSALFAHFF